MNGIVLLNEKKSNNAIITQDIAERQRFASFLRITHLLKLFNSLHRFQSKAAFNNSIYYRTFLR